jgi:hypothetical protein
VTMRSAFRLALIAWSFPSCISIRDLSHHQWHAILLENRPNGSGILVDDLLQLGFERSLPLAYPHRDLEREGGCRTAATERR